MSKSKGGYKSWIEQQRERFGTDWVSKLSSQNDPRKPSEISRNAFRIINDIARGNFDMENDYKDFMFQMIVAKSVLSYCYQRAAALKEIVEAFNNLKTTQPNLYNSGTAMVHNRCMLSMNIYMKSYEELYLLTEYGGDVTHFINFQHNLSAERNYLDLNRLW